MGTDIHIALFREEAPGIWDEIPYQVRSWRDEKRPVDGFPVAPNCFTNRNYALFEILAGVGRPSYPWLEPLLKMMANDGKTVQVESNVDLLDNAHEQEKRWLPIVMAEQRKWPDFVVEAELLPEPDDPEGGPRYMGYHDKTYVTLEELEKYPWGASSAELTGAVKADEYERLKESGECPASSCGMVGGEGVETYEPDEYEQAKKEGRLVPHPYVQMRWDETARSATYNWISRVLPFLRERAEGKPLMLVLGFDS